MQVICKVSDDAKVQGEDWDSLMWHNGKLFSGSFSNGTIKVWSVDLKSITEFIAHEFPIYHMTPGNGTTFFTSSSDCTIKHWEEMADGSFRLLTTLEGHSEPPKKLCFLNGRLYSGDDKGDVKVWNGERCIGTVETMEEIWDLLAITDHFITVRHVDVTVFTVKDNDDKVRACIKTSIPGRYPLHITSTGLFCCVERMENIVNVRDWKTQGNPSMGKLKGHEAIINTMTSVGNTLITGGYDKCVITWNLETMQQTGNKLSTDGSVNVMTANPEGYVYIGGENKFIVCIKV